MKKLIAFLLVMQMLCVPAFAAEVSDPEAASTNTEQTEIQPRVEETEWFFRYNEELGIYEQRLWSYTYGCWKTDWMPVV